MKNSPIRLFLLPLASAAVIMAGVDFFDRHESQGYELSVSEMETDFEEESVEPVLPVDPFEAYAGWQRPEGPLRVALQAGHWKATEAPEELKRIRTNGTYGGGKSEWEVCLRIAEETKKLLEAEGIIVDILPTTIPPDYWADAFVSIHADGNPNTDVSGFKVAAPRRDRTGKAARLAELLYEEYETSTGLKRDPNVTRNMRGYYAFNWRRYDHALHPMTPAAILETGFLTSPSDRRVIVQSPKKSAQGVAAAILEFLRTEPEPSI